MRELSFLKTTVPSIALASVMTLAGMSTIPLSQAGTNVIQPKDISKLFPELKEEPGKNLAYDKYAPTIPPSLTKHSRKMEKAVYHVCCEDSSQPQFYLAVGYGLANSAMVYIPATNPKFQLGGPKIIIIDVMETLEAGLEVMQAFKQALDITEVTDDAFREVVKAVVLTHNHYDHVGGMRAFVSQTNPNCDINEGNNTVNIPIDEDNGACIFAQENLMDAIANTASVVGPITDIRSAYSFGNILEKGPFGSVNEGIGPTLRSGQATFLPPTTTFEETLTVKVDKVEMVLQYVPSETDDEIVAWFPQNKVLHTAEVIQGESFPNLHTLRGTKYRDPYKWFKSIDLMRNQFRKAKYLIPAHGRPIIGKKKIRNMLTAYRDAIQYVHDQSVRYINKGLTPDELVEVIPELPPHLKDNPWLGEFYGTVKHSVRQIYVGYLGWFEADPTFLDPLPPIKRATRHVEQMGGRDAVYQGAQESYEAGDFRWTAELLTYLIRIDHNDMAARRLKAEALRSLGYQATSINWRNWYITAARELDETLNLGLLDAGSTLQAPDFMASLPPDKLIEGMTVKLDSVKSEQATMIVGFCIQKKSRDLDHCTGDCLNFYALEIRRGVAEMHTPTDTQVEELKNNSDVILNTTLEDLQKLLMGQLTYEEAIAQKWLTLTSTDEDDGEVLLTRLNRFLSYFDPPSRLPPKLIVR